MQIKSYRTANNEEYETIKAAVKELLGNKASVRRERSSKRSYNSVSIRPTSKASMTTENGKVYPNLWTADETLALKALVENIGIETMGGFYEENAAMIYNRGFQYLYFPA